ncbi:hypothetical protein MNBD_ALPHA05-1249, partial [hydrothermal vent metagenome]
MKMHTTTLLSQKAQNMMNTLIAMSTILQQTKRATSQRTRTQFILAPCIRKF